MTLTRFSQSDAVVSKIKILRPKIPRTIPTPLKVEPRSKRYSLVGTAFDYLLRFELQRRASHAIVRRWVAEYAPDLIYRKRDDGIGVVGNSFYKVEWAMSPEELRERVEEIITAAKAEVERYLKTEAPTYDQQASLATHAIRLAHLDSVYRAGYLDPMFDKVDPADVEDLLDMLAIAPFDDLLHDDVLYLNPDFGESSRLVGNADTDIITGDILVEIKVTKKGRIEDKYLDQLLGYFLLARHQRGINPAFPEIKQVGIYFGRHGYLWVLNTDVWTEHPQFSEIEEWFFEYAQSVYGSAQSTQEHVGQLRVSWRDKMLFYQRKGKQNKSKTNYPMK